MTVAPNNDVLHPLEPETSKKAQTSQVLQYHTPGQLPQHWQNISFHPVEYSYIENLHWFTMLRTLPTPLAVQIIVVLAAAWYGRSKPDGWYLTISFALQFIFFSFLIFWTQLNAAYRLWAAYTIIMSDDGISRIATKLPSLHIPFPEISKIQENHMGIFVRGRTRSDVIFIPKGVQQYDRVRFRLSKVSTLQLQIHPYLHLAGIHAIAVTAALSAVLAFLHALDNSNWLVVTIYAVVLTAFGGWLVVGNFRNPNVSLGGKILSVSALMPAMMLFVKLGFDLFHPLSVP